MQGGNKEMVPAWGYGADIHNERKVERSGADNVLCWIGVKLYTPIPMVFYSKICHSSRENKTMQFKNEFTQYFTITVLLNIGKVLCISKCKYRGKY